MYRMRSLRTEMSKEDYFVDYDFSMEVLESERVLGPPFFGKFRFVVRKSFCDRPEFDSKPPIRPHIHLPPNVVVY